MRRIPRIASVYLLVLILVGQYCAQFTVPLNPGVEPFSIRPGSTFSASAGEESGDLYSRRRQITAEIREAEHIILKNYVGTDKTGVRDLTRSVMDGMLRSLDPHSNYFDPLEWKDLMDEERSGYSGIGA